MIKGKFKKFLPKLLRGNSFYGKGIYSVGQTVYLSEGRNKGLRPGSLLQVEQGDGGFKQVRGGGDKYPKIFRSLGWIKIIRAEEFVSTGIVVTSYDLISSGDRISAE